MAERVPGNFLRSSPQNIASYDFFELAKGTGSVVLYAGLVNNSLKLSNLQWYSERVKISTEDGGGAFKTDATFTKHLDKDFDIELERPLIIEGEAIVNATITIRCNAAAEHEAYFIAKARKVSGGTETDLDTTQGQTFYFNETGASNKSKEMSIDLNIPRTKFRTGDTLRLTIEVWGKELSGAGAHYGFGCDPQDRNDEQLILTSSITIEKMIEDNDTTQLLFILPVVLNT